MFEGNPVLPNPGIKDFRDPKVFWHEASRQWVMALAVLDHIQFFGSPDLKTWRFLSAFGAEAGSHGGVWECPDLFPLPTPDGRTQWVLLVSINAGGPNGGSATQYFLGDFDGTTFTNAYPPETTRWLDWGRDNYAGVTWSDVPEADGRRLFIGWMSNWDYGQVVPTERWRSAMTVPRTFSLFEAADGLRLASQPIEELQRLRGEPVTLTATTVEGHPSLESLRAASLFEAVIEVDLGGSAAEKFGIELTNEKGETYRFGYDRAAGHLFSDRTEAGPAFSDAFATGPHTAPYRSSRERMRLHLFVDKSSIEVFVDEGRAVITDLLFPAAAFDQARLFAEGGPVTLARATLYPMDSIWE